MGTFFERWIALIRFTSCVKNISHYVRYEDELSEQFFLFLVDSSEVTPPVLTVVGEATPVSIEP